MGVIDSKLSAAINETCGIKCSHVGVVPEVNNIIYFVSVKKKKKSLVSSLYCFNEILLLKDFSFQFKRFFVVLNFSLLNWSLFFFKPLIYENI